jgi:cell division protein FtsI (penicillin-binding protein 3)
VFQRIAQQVLEYMHVPHDLPLPSNRQVWLAQNRVKDSDLDEGSPDRLGSVLEVADSGPDTTPLPPQPKPTAAQAAVVPAALREKEPAPHAAAISALAKTGTPAPQPANGTVVLDVEQGGIEVPSFIGKSVRSAIETAQDSGLELNPVGSGIAREQTPAAGSHVTAGSRVLVKFAR